MKKLNTVKVIFKNPKYNYTTDVSSTSTKEDCEKYFIGARLDMGRFPVEDMQTPIEIEFIDNNK